MAIKLSIDSLALYLLCQRFGRGRTKATSMASSSETANDDASSSTSVDIGPDSVDLDCANEDGDDDEEEEDDEEDDGHFDATPAACCRLCGKEDDGEDAFIAIFGPDGRLQGLPDKCGRVLPVAVSEDDELSKSICGECRVKVENVAAFFDSCQSATQQQIIHLRKRRQHQHEEALELDQHINQYMRSFNAVASSSASIKLEPSALCDVDIDEEVDEDEDRGVFKIPNLPLRKSGFTEDDFYLDLKTEDLHQLNGATSSSSSAPRKRFEPLALKTCSECGETFPDLEATLSHWSERHPEKTASFKCTAHECDFSTEDISALFHHRRDHRKEYKRQEEE